VHFKEKSEVKVPVSAFIMTLNEENNLRACVDSLHWVDEVVIVDSESSDKTRELAERLGCRVVTKRLVSWSEHQNWVLRNVTFRNEWVLNVDADETIPPDLAEEIRAVVTKNTDTVAYRFRRKDYFLGRWLKHASFYPLWLTRLYKPQTVSFERLVNPITKIDGLVSDLEGHLIHHPFSKGVSHWFERHNSYSTLEAREYRKVETVTRPGLFASDVNERRRAFKSLFLRLPFRPLVKFVFLYFFKLGFLDGKAGFYYSTMQAFYEFMISVKLVELQQLQLTPSPLESVHKAA
jgi:glycosyltransferase involved in cell wall biosynthesis